MGVKFAVQEHSTVSPVMTQTCVLTILSRTLCLKKLIQNKNVSLLINFKMASVKERILIFGITLLYVHVHVLLY